MIASHSCAWQRLSQHSLLACAARRKRLVSLNARKSCDSWLKTSWLARISSPFVTAFRSLQVCPKTEDPTAQTAKITFCVSGVISPILANLYLHHALDLWVDAWRKKRARGDVIIVRYADDAVLGFERREDAEQFLEQLRERLAKFGLELHPEKTRLIEFGRFAAERRKRRGEGKPETFHFLGFTHICGTNYQTGKFTVHRKTIGKRMAAKLKDIRAQLRQRMHERLPGTGKWLQQVVRGYFQYHAIPGNSARMRAFRSDVLRSWLQTLRRRSQNHRMNWERAVARLDSLLPPAQTVHPYPDVRFDAKHPR
jgi:RNA-directed DNA polymerase